MIFLICMMIFLLTHYSLTQIIFVYFQFHEMIESLKFSYGYQALWGNDSEFNEL